MSIEWDKFVNYSRILKRFDIALHVSNSTKGCPEWNWSVNGPGISEQGYCKTLTQAKTKANSIAWKHIKSKGLL